jgi:hypothetical protein
MSVLDDEAFAIDSDEIEESKLMAELQYDIDDTNSDYDFLAEEYEATLYDTLVGPVIMGMGNIKKYVQTSAPEYLDSFTAAEDAFMAFNDKMAYGDEIEVDDMPGFEGTRDSLDSLSIREEIPTAEGKRTANSRILSRVQENGPKAPTSINELSEKEKEVGAFRTKALVAADEAITTGYTSKFMVSYDYDESTVDHLVFRPTMESAEKSKDKLEATGMFAGKNLRIEEVPTAEGKRTANSKLINEGSFFDRYDSEASVKVGRALTDIVDIFNKTAEEEDREVAEMIKAAEEETGTEVTRLERIYLNKHKQWIRTLAFRMER